jgi:hypothetical protein
MITLENIDYFYLLTKQSTLIDYTEANFSEETDEITSTKFKFGKYNINIKFNCNERKDERGNRYTLDINSWEDVKLT